MSTTKRFPENGTRLLPIRTVTTEERRNELLRKLADYERRYGCTSEEMLESLRNGAYDTIEIATWMYDYRSLKRLEQRAGRLAVGAPTKIS